MGDLIEVHEIEEFSRIMRVPPEAIQDSVLSSVRQLDERREMERFIREILHDPSETPHGPTEIADVLTTHVHVRGEKKLAAFVLKGRSFPRLSSREVTYQLIRVRQIPGLAVLVLAAVGTIQDDARRDFLQVAADGQYDHLIINAHDLARLLIAYEKICPTDGTPYDECGTCGQGHSLDEGVRIEMDVREEIAYSVVRLKDVSHAGAKRYVGTILLDRHYSRDVIRQVIRDATESLRHQNYYRNELTQSHWGATPAHVVWLFLAYDLDDIQVANWVCRTQWIDPALLEGFRPFPLRSRERIDDIAILWNERYRQRKGLYAGYRGSKGEVLEALAAIVQPMVDLARQGAELFEAYQRGTMPEESLVSALQGMQPEVRKLYLQSGSIPIPPADCREYEDACQELFAVIDNMFLFYSERGLEQWPSDTREWLMQTEVGRFRDQLKKLEFEEDKLH